MNKLIKFLIPFIVIAILLCSCSNKKVEHTVLNMTNEDLALCSQFIWLYYDYANYLADEQYNDTLENIDDFSLYIIKIITSRNENNEYINLTNILSARDYLDNLFSDGYTDYYILLFENTKKEVIYQEVDGEKIPITQSVIMPTIEGAIITAVGAGNATVKSNIIQAVEAATGLATHKIQVFPMAT